FLERHDDLLVRLHAPEYAARRDAFAEAVRAKGEPPAALLAFALRDPSPLLRSEAVVVAAKAALFPMVRESLQDESGIVRAAAASSPTAGRSGASSPHGGTTRVRRPRSSRTPRRRAFAKRSTGSRRTPPRRSDGDRGALGGRLDRRGREALSRLVARARGDRR